MGEMHVNPFEILKSQHREIESLLQLAEHEAAPQTTEMRVMVRMLQRKLEAHMRLEEEVFYPSIELVVGPAIIADNESEHAAVRALLEELNTAQSQGSEGFLETLTSLKQLVERHVEDEEQELFFQVRRRLGMELLEELGAEMEAFQAETQVAAASFEDAVSA